MAHPFKPKADSGVVWHHTPPGNQDSPQAHSGAPELQENPTAIVFGLAVAVFILAAIGLNRSIGNEEWQLGALMISGAVAAVIGLRAVLVWFLRPFVEMFRRRP